MMLKLMVKFIKIHRPFGRACQNIHWGKVYLPPTPFRPGPLAANPWSQFVHSLAMRILGPYFGPKGLNPATRSFPRTLASIWNLSELVRNLGARSHLGTNSFKLT